MKIAEIAAKIAASPGVDYVFRRRETPNRLVKWRHPAHTDQYRSLWTGGDPWAPHISDLTAEDWEFDHGS